MQTIIKIPIVYIKLYYLYSGMVPTLFFLALSSSFDVCMPDDGAIVPQQSAQLIIDQFM